MKKNQVFIEENTPVDKVYILTEGTVKGSDFRMFGIVYDYIWFKPFKIFGSMEILLEIDNFMTTLITVTECKMLVLSKKIFSQWMNQDIHALQIETKSMGTYLLEQSRRDRLFLFVQGVDRVFLLFTQIYEQEAIHKRCLIRLTRRELADRSGLSIKTVNRAVLRMEEEAYIGRQGRQVIITERQYMRMKEYLHNIIAGT